MKLFARRGVLGWSALGVAPALACCTERPPEPEAPDANTAYGKIVTQQIREKVYYPHWLVEARKQAIVFMVLVISRNGELIDAKVAYTTDRLFNTPALNAVRQAAPFPPLPGEQATLLLPVVFSLKR